MLQKQANKSVIDKTKTKDLRIAIVRTDYHVELINNLEKKAIETLEANGVESKNISVFTAPGSWEIPLVTQSAIKTQKFDAVIAFGIIIKGDTYHFEMIANECARALMQLSLEHSIPIGFEVLAVYTKEQAIERASDNEYNKGIEAATAVLKVLTSK